MRLVPGPHASTIVMTPKIHRYRNKEIELLRSFTTSAHKSKVLDFKSESRPTLFFVSTRCYPCLLIKMILLLNVVSLSVLAMTGVTADGPVRAYHPSLFVCARESPNRCYRSPQRADARLTVLWVTASTCCSLLLALLRRA